MPRSCSEYNSESQSPACIANSNVSADLCPASFVQERWCTKPIELDFFQLCREVRVVSYSTCPSMYLLRQPDASSNAWVGEDKDLETMVCESTSSQSRWRCLPNFFVLVEVDHLDKAQLCPCSTLSIPPGPSLNFLGVAVHSFETFINSLLDRNNLPPPPSSCSRLIELPYRAQFCCLAS